MIARSHEGRLLRRTRTRRRAPAALALSSTALTMVALWWSPTIHAAEPAPEAFLDAAADAGLACSPQGSGSWICEPADLLLGVATISSSGDGVFTADVARDRDGAVDLRALMDRFVDLALAENGEAQAWWDGVQSGRPASAIIERAGWTLEWSAQADAVSPGELPPDRLLLTYDPDDAAAVPSGNQGAGASPPTGGAVQPPASSLGEWRYDGTWTVVSREIDTDLEIDPPVGTTRSAVLSIACVDEAFPCLASLVHPDGTSPFIGELQLLGPGRLQRIETETLPGCAQTRTRTIDVQHGMEAAVVSDVETFVPRTCVDGDETSWAWDTTTSFSGTLTSFTPVPGGAPSASAAASPDGSAGVPPSSAPVDASGQPGDPGAPIDPELPGASASGAFAASVPTAAEISTDPSVVLQSLALAALLVFLMPFPSQLFNSTLEANEDRVRRRLRLDRLGSGLGRLGAFWTSWPGVGIFTVIAATLYGFLDPSFGLGPGSLATFLGLLIGIVVVTVVFAVPLIAIHRAQGDRAWLKVVPVSLLIGVGCVLISRLTDFQPGYLYGLLIGVGFARELSAAAEGRATAIAAALMLGAAFVAWLLLGAMPAGGSFGDVVARTTLAAIMVAGLEGVVFGLLPMRFLPGQSLYRWNRRLWAALLLIGAFAFFHILINPASGYLSDTSRTPLLTVVVLLVGFTLGSIAFWAWFRLRPAPPIEGT